MNDPRDPQTEDQIRRALSARAQEIDVSPNAFDKIRSSSPTSPWARPAAYAAVAAIVVVFLVGVALLTSPRDDNGGLDNDIADGTTTLPPDSTAPPTTSEAPSTTSTPTPSTSTPEPTGPQSTALGEPLQIDPATGFGLWTNADGLPADQAVVAFLADVHGLTDVDISPTPVALADGISSAGVEAFGVHRRGENGDTLESFAFKVVTHTPENGTARVVLVLSDEFEIESAVGVSDGIRVTGRGRAFEGSAVLEAQGMQTLVTVGATELAPFTAVAPLGEHCPCVITLTGSTAFEGEVPSIASYSINPALATSTATYSVFGVADDDVLNVRNGAGVSNDIITTFAPDATGIILTGNEATVGSARWVEVETEDARGWVHSQFLVAVPDDAADHRIVEILHDVSTLDPRLFDDVVDFGGIGVYADWPTPWTTVSSSDFDVARNWSPDGTEERCPECTATVEEFLGFDTAKWELAEYTAGPDVDLDWQNFFFEVGQFPEFFDRFVTGTISIPEPNPDVSLDWRRYTVVFDFEDSAPVIRGIWRWGWTP